MKNTSIQYIKGVGPARAVIFARLGIETVEDLMYFFPRRYEDRRTITPIAQVQVGESQTIIGNVVTQSARKSWYTKKHVSEVILDDGGGRIFCVWFNQPFLQRYFKEGARVVCHGKVDMYKNRLQMVSPEYEIIDDEHDSLSLERIVPVYPLTRGITQRYLRKVVDACLSKYKGALIDELSVPLRNKHKLMNIKRSIENIHFPKSFKDQEAAINRISFEEFYFFQVSVRLRRLSIVQKTGIAHKATDAQTLQFIDHFPFELTRAQKRVITEIRDDMKKASPMLRLLQGDVGSGKTLVAFYGCAVATANKCQSAVMAPTEILANQHYEKMQQMIKDGILPKMRVALLVSGLKTDERLKLLKDIKQRKIDCVIGTHALISGDVVFKKLSFVVIDEQHKFGVRQRALLTEKGINPDVLIMTATPIPRTLCITLYGDLDISIIDEMPKGRGKVATTLHTHENAGEVYKLIKEELKAGRQAYVIYPMIEESQTQDLKAAQTMFKRFKAQEFKGFKIALIHGQMKKDDTEKIMLNFKNKKLDLLVATTVLEVGIDVPNASVMTIEHAERFGLSQLHQLRGRIGRGKDDGYCFLISDPTTDEGVRRLKAMVKTINGFKIAEEDLVIRGPGQFFGRHQHGLNELKIANPLTQIEMLELARTEALDLTEQDPYLKAPANKSIKKLIIERYPTYLDQVQAG